MRLKRLDVGLKTLAIGLAVSWASATADAQLSDGKWRLPPRGSGGTAVEVKQQPTVFIDPGSSFHNPSFPRRPVAFQLVPAILMSDGSIFANFGFGFEPVVRPCSGIVQVGRHRRIASNGVVLSEATRMPYTQPVPNQQTASQQMLSSSPQRAQSQAARFACFNRDAAGSVFVFRRI